MKFGVKREKLALHPEQILRLAGYKFITDHKTGKESFVHQPGRNRYPRFHIYLKDEADVTFFNIHLDQKEAIYPGQHAHNAEYEGEVVEREVVRVKAVILQNVKRN